MPKSHDIISSGGISKGTSLSNTLSSFEEALLEKAEDMGLPSEGVLIDVAQRVRVLENLDGAMALLPQSNRAGAMYLSKFMMAVSAGLFDAALNYLWDETITELRKRIVSYDLQYFFDLAVSAPEKRKSLRGEEDLHKITDDELIRAAQQIGFISVIGKEQLDLVRYMRNHASAAHPNQHEITPYVLLGYMETCIKEVITLPNTSAMVETSRLLMNIKTEVVTVDQAAGYRQLFSNLRWEQAETLANGLFGIYVSDESTSVIRDNVRLLLPHLWDRLTEEVKSSFGIRYARFKANLDVNQATLARELLESVDGASYLPEDIREAEIDSLLDRLSEIHNAFNNFYNEPPLARELVQYVGTSGAPDGVRGKYVRVLVDVFIGNRSGVASGALSSYEQLIRSFTPKEARLALFLITGDEFAWLLGYNSPLEQFDSLTDLLKPKVVGRSAKALLEAVESFTGKRKSLYLDSGIKRLREKLEANM